MRGHARRLLAMTEVDIVALVEPIEQNLARMVETHPQLKTLPTFSDHREMLKGVQPDAVEISTPHTFHYQQIIDALSAGAHVLVEKPMVCSTAHAEDVCLQSKQWNRIVAVSYQRHTQPVFAKMRQMIEAGDVGDIQFITCLQNQNWYQRQRTGQGWRAKRELSGGGQLNDSGSHMVDIMLWVTSLAPATVFCAQQNFELEVDVNSAITVTFTNGAIGTLNIVGNAPGVGGSVWEDITIYGSEGALYYRMLAQPGHKVMLEYRKFGQDEPNAITDLPESSDPDRNFASAILGREPVASPPLCGLRVIQLSETAWKSASTGCVEAVQASRT
jgi:predicted dehydrogenase